MKVGYLCYVKKIGLSCHCKEIILWLLLNSASTFSYVDIIILNIYH